MSNTMKDMFVNVRDSAKKWFSAMTIARWATLLTVAAAAILLLVLSDWLWARVTGTVRLTNDQFGSTLIWSLIATILSGMVALVAIGLHARGWRNLQQAAQQWRTVAVRQMIPALGAALTLIVALIFLLGILRPKVQVALFAQEVQRLCGAPLMQVASDIQGAAHAASQDTFADSAFAAAMEHYSQRFQQDAVALPHELAQVNALKAPDPRFQGMVTGCAAEYQSLSSFLGGANSITLPTILPAPLGGMQLSATSMLHLIAQLNQGQVAGAPQLPAFLLGPLVASTLGMAQTTCDASCQQLKDTGSQLQNDIFAPFKPATPAS